MSGPYQRRREGLFRKNPHCPICGRKMRLVKFGKHGGESGVGKARGDVATIDHIHSKLSGKRREVTDWTETTRLVCRRCNQLLQRRENKELPIEQLWARTGGYPWNWGPLDAGYMIHIMATRRKNGEGRTKKLSLRSH